MKISNGNILIFIGFAHSILGISPLAFGQQFARFGDQFFINVSGGILEFPFLNGNMNYETMTAFWFFYFGLLLVLLGVLVKYIESIERALPMFFVWGYLVFVLIGVIMIPFSGMTFIMLPHAIYMIYSQRKMLEKTPSQAN